MVDGGFILAAKREATNVAEQAARAGAQAVVVASIRSGRGHHLDPARARAQADAYLARVGRRGTVAVDGARVRVAVIARPMVILGVGGLGEVQVTGRAAARNVRGLVRGEE